MAQADEADADFVEGRRAQAHDRPPGQSAGARGSSGRARDGGSGARAGELEEFPAKETGTAGGITIGMRCWHGGGRFWV
jgi:hypothetical protein